MHGNINDTISAYEIMGEKYLKSIQDATPHEIKLFMKLLPPAGKVLDVGCAGGRDSKIFVSHEFSVTGIDLSETFIEIAKKNVPNACFLKQDLLDLDFGIGSFNGIWASAVLLHLSKKDLPGVLDNFYRMLRKNGVLFVSLKQGKGEKVVQDDLITGLGRFFSFYSITEAENTVIKAGFKIIYCKVRDDDIGRKTIKWIMLIAKK